VAQSAKRHSRNQREYEILVTSLGEGGATRRYHASRLNLALLLLGSVALIVLLTLGVLLFTPVAMVVPLPSPLLEEKYGRQIRDTQQRLTDLASEVLVLRDYNTQLRKALGEGGTVDSLGRQNYPASLSLTGTARNEASARQRSIEGALEAVGTPEIPPAGLGQVTAATPVRMRAPRSPSRFPLLLPTEGYISQGFDPERGHFGMDIAGKRGTPVCAAADGHVVFSGWTYEDGNVIILAHGGGLLTVYKHNQALLRGAQVSVKRGDPIALLGTSGKTSLGPHLHFEVWMNGAPQDPAEFILRP
jgi:murein DD-endopeptidase MepM/ murein hydrolase activator NlpD